MCMYTKNHGGHAKALCQNGGGHAWRTPAQNNKFLCAGPTQPPQPETICTHCDSSHVLFKKSVNVSYGICYEKGRFKGSISSSGVSFDSGVNSDSGSEEPCASEGSSDSIELKLESSCEAAVNATPACRSALVEAKQQVSLANVTLYRAKKMKVQAAQVLQSADDIETRAQEKADKMEEKAGVAEEKAAAAADRAAEADDKAKEIVDEAKSTAGEILSEARSTARSLVDEANSTAKELRSQARSDADRAIANAKSKAHQIILKANKTECDLKTDAEKVVDAMLEKAKAEITDHTFNAKRVQQEAEVAAAKLKEESETTAAKLIADAKATAQAIKQQAKWDAEADKVKTDKNAREAADAFVTSAQAQTKWERARFWEEVNNSTKVKMYQKQAQQAKADYDAMDSVLKAACVRDDKGIVTMEGD